LELRNCPHRIEVQSEKPRQQPGLQTGLAFHQGANERHEVCTRIRDGMQDIRSFAVLNLQATAMDWTQFRDGWEAEAKRAARNICSDIKGNT
jgi:hypothetical protein